MASAPNFQVPPGTPSLWDAGEGQACSSAAPTAPHRGAPITVLRLLLHRRDPAMHSLFEEGVVPLTRPQSRGSSSQRCGIRLPLPQACSVLASGQKDTVHRVSDPPPQT